MKTTLLLIAVFLAGSTAAIIAAHPFRTPPITEVAVLRDITDPASQQPDTARILSLYNLNGGSIWYGATFHFSDLSDVSYTKDVDLSLSPANQWLSNEPEREKEVRQFQNDVSQTLVTAEREPTGKKQSSLYLPIANELMTLSKSSADRKVLLLYSDLMENTTDVSFYNSKTFRQLQQNPNALLEMFEREQPLPSLAGIEIHLLYAPSTPAQDEAYRTAATFYKNLFEQKGATVTIFANLTN